MYWSSWTKMSKFLSDPFWPHTHTKKYRWSGHKAKWAKTESVKLMRVFRGYMTSSILLFVCKFGEFGEFFPSEFTVCCTIWYATRSAWIPHVHASLMSTFKMGIIKILSTCFAMRKVLIAPWYHNIPQKFKIIVSLR